MYDKIHYKLKKKKDGKKKKNSGVGWIFLRALEYIQKDHKNLMSLSIQLKS